MPKIVDLVPIGDRLGVVLDVPPDSEGSVTIWTDAEAREALRRAYNDGLERAAEYCEMEGDADLAVRLRALKETR